jgi:hypothetical protein
MTNARKSGRRSVIIPDPLWDKVCRAAVKEHGAEMANMSFIIRRWISEGLVRDAERARLDRHVARAGGAGL